MKDSGIEWIGEIPKDWGTIKLLYVLDRPITDGPHETPLYVDEGVPFITINNIDDAGNIDKENANKISYEDAATYNKKAKMKVGDLLFSKSATIGRIAEVDKLDFMVWSPFAILSPKTEVLNKQFLKLLLTLPGYIDHIIGLGSVNTQINIGMRDMEKSIIPLPNIEYQIKISKFLIKKTKKVECIKSLLIKEIQTLEDYKKSVITEAVTKGLDKNVEMKDSGIEWIGEIPKHWNTIKAEILFNIKDGTHDTPKYVEKDINKDTKPLITTRNIKKNIIDFESANHISYEDFKSIYKRSDVEKYDLIMPMIGTIGSPVIVDTDKKFAIKNVALLKMNKDKYFSKYIYYQFHSEYVEQQMRVNTKGGVQFFVSMEVISRLYMLTIKRNEIVEIVNYLNKKTKLIDESIEAKQKQLEVLEEYKKSLIYEYVTGKKEVE